MTQPRPTSASFERMIELEGAVNFRDLGGYETADGRHIRWRALFRADGLSALTPADLLVIGALGIVTVIDLRTDTEVEQGRFPVDRHPVDFHHLPLIESLPDPESFKVAPGMLEDQYQSMTRDSPAQISTALTVLANPAALPAVVHCTAGKDRTGVIAALLLGLLGVPDEAVVADYALSNAAMVRLRQKLIQRYPDAEEFIATTDEIFSADPANITALFKMLRQQHGSIEGYVEAIGTPPRVVEALRQNLLA